MSGDFHLPDIGEGLEEAEIVRWLVSVGERVIRDQPIVEIMTDKSNAELPAPWSGTVARLGGKVGDVLGVGAVLVVIETDSEAAGSSTGAFQRETGVHEAAPPPPPFPEVEAEAGVDTWPSPEPAWPDPTDLAAASDWGDEPTPHGPGATDALAGPSDDLPARPLPAPRPEPAATSSAGASTSNRPKASPATRKAAAERGIDLTQIQGSGPGGRILAADLDRHAEVGQRDPKPSSEPASPDSTGLAGPTGAAEPTANPAQQQRPATEPTSETTTARGDSLPTEPTRPARALSGAVAPLRGIRRVVAHNMARSWTEIPHIHASEHIDAEPLLAFRASLKDSENPAFANVTPLAILVAAVASALDKFGQANASIDMVAQTITYHSKVNVGIAVAAPQGLVVPVIEDAANRTLADLAVELGHLVQGARADSLERNDYAGGTATVTNFGSLGGEMALPLIRPPEAVIVGFGSIAKRPFVIEDDVVARSTMNVVLGADHRLVDGDVTTAVLSHITTLITKPIRLLTGS